MTTFFLPRKSESFTFLSFARWLLSSKSGAISPTSGMSNPPGVFGCIANDLRLTRFAEPFKSENRSNDEVGRADFRVSVWPRRLCVKDPLKKLHYERTGTRGGRIVSA